MELLDKRGYLTVCLSLSSSSSSSGRGEGGGGGERGKVYLRRPEGIREWFHALQVRFRANETGHSYLGVFLTFHLKKVIFAKHIMVQIKNFDLFLPIKMKSFFGKDTLCDS